MREVGLDELEVVDAESYEHIAVFSSLHAFVARRGARFAVVEGAAAEDRARLLNLAYWSPGEVAEIVDEPAIAADQLAHSAWHLAVADHLGDEARTAVGLLLAESIASAFDLYLVGRLVGMNRGADFLETQVPAMREAAEAAGMDDPAFEALLSRAHEAPETAFEELRALLFDVARALVAARDAGEADAVLSAQQDAPLAPLLHHYELPSWILFARAYGSDGASPGAEALDRELRAASDPIALLEQRLGLDG